MSAADESDESPTLEELQIQLEALRRQIGELTPPGLGKVVDKVQERPAALALAALGIGLVVGCILTKSYMTAPATTARHRLTSYGAFWPSVERHRPQAQPHAGRNLLRDPFRWPRQSADARAN